MSKYSVNFVLALTQLISFRLCTCSQVPKCRGEYKTLIDNVLKESGVASTNHLFQPFNHCMENFINLDSEGPDCDQVIHEGYNLCQKQISDTIHPFLNMMIQIHAEMSV